MINSLADIIIKGNGMMKLFKNVYIVGEYTEINGHEFGHVIKNHTIDFMEHPKDGYSDGGFVPTDVVEKETEPEPKKDIPRGKVVTHTTSIGGMKVTEETWVPLDEVSLKDISTSDLLEELINRTGEDYECE